MTTLKYTARIDTLWMCAGMCGVAIGAAYGPLLLIHSVSGSVPTEAWADPQRDGMRPKVIGGGGIVYNVQAACRSVAINSTNVSL